MPFTHPAPDWNAQGAEPPESLRTNGWQINQKPPADYFNWFFYNSAKAIIELQLEAINIDQKGAPDGIATLGADGKVPASQLNVSAPPDASTTTKGVVQLSNSTTSTSEVLAATPKAVKTVDNKVGPLESLITDNKTNLVGAMNEVTQGFYETYWTIGDLANLNTVAKGSVVSAVNEVNGKVGILSGLKTTAKDNLVNAVNELFTFANDGKTKWSSVIGSPLVSDDTFTQMQSKTQTIKDTLATNLTAKGQASAGSEALQALANKVVNITQSPFAGIPMQTQSGQGSYSSVRGVNTDGELYVQSSYTISRIKYGGTVLQTWTSRPLNTVWFCEERYCLTRSSPTGSQVYNAAGTLLYDSASSLYDNGSGSWGPTIMSYDGEVCYNIPNAGAWLYYLPKNGGVQSVSWSAYVLINPYIVYDKVAKTGRIIAFGGGSGAAPSRMVTQSGSTVSAPSMHINESIFFHTYKL